MDKSPSEYFPCFQSFVTHYVFNNPNKAWILSHLSHLYVLVGKQSSETLSTSIKWCNILSDAQLERMQRDEYCVLGFLGIDTKRHYTAYIYYIDTLLRGHDLARWMMREYAKMFGFHFIFPQEILPEARDFWRKWFEREYGVSELGAFWQKAVNAAPSSDYLQWSALTE